MYQPIVDLDDGTVVGLEALARGPRGESPAALFAAAGTPAARMSLDWECRAAALDTALDVGIARPLTLFVNAEPSTLLASAPVGFPELSRRAASAMPLILEVTERDLVRQPADLLATLAEVREAGWGIAVDDVGAADASLALLPILQPDVIKLDLRLVQQRTTTEVAAVVSAVLAEAERSGALILAEGIETAQHEELAVSLGARLGQGFRFGRPAPLTAPPAGKDLPLTLSRARLDLDRSITPWALVRHSTQVRRASKALLLSLSRHLERQAVDSGAVVLASFQIRDHFTLTAARRYTVLARNNSLVAVFADDMPTEPAPGVRGAPLAPGDPICQEWNVLVLGPHYAAGLISLDLGDGGADGARRFDYVVTHDRDLVVAGMRAMLSRVPPLWDATEPSAAEPAGEPIGDDGGSLPTGGTGLDRGPGALSTVRPAPPLRSSPARVVRRTDGHGDDVLTDS